MGLLHFTTRHTVIHIIQIHVYFMVSMVRWKIGHIYTFPEVLIISLSGIKVSFSTRREAHYCAVPYFPDKPCNSFVITFDCDSGEEVNGKSIPIGKIDKWKGVILVHEYSMRCNNNINYRFKLMTK